MAGINEFSHAHSILVMNNARVVGLADEDPPVDIPRFNLGEMMRGPDGSSYFMSRRTIGGPVTVKLLPSSATAIQWMTMFTSIIRENAKLNFEGAYGDTQLGISTKFVGGKLVDAPVAIVPGVTLEFMFEFSEIIPDMSGAQLLPGFIVSNQAAERREDQSAGGGGGEGG